jgi:uncharacterized protein
MRRQVFGPAVPEQPRHQLRPGAAGYLCTVARMTSPGSAGSDDVPAELAELAGRVFDMARSGNTAMLAAYLDAGVPVNLTNSAGDTLLMLAAYHGHPATVQVLIRREAAVDRANDRGQTPLAAAVFKGDDEVVRLLAEAGASPFAGRPNAVDTARMFERTGYLEMFGA